MINFIPVNEVTVIIKPKVIPSPRIKGETETHFYDLSGNRVSKIPKTKRIICLENDCYLGLKGEKWVTVDSKEVEKNMWLKDFVIKHSIIKNSNDDNLWTLLSKKEQELIEDKGENKFKLIYSKYGEVLDNYFQIYFGSKLYMSNDNFGINGKFNVRTWDSYRNKYKWDETELLETYNHLKSLSEIGFNVPIGEETSNYILFKYTIYKVDVLNVYFPTSSKYTDEKYNKDRLCFFDFLKKYKKEGDVWGYDNEGFSILFKLRDELESLIKELKKKYIDDVKKEKIEVEKEVKSLVKSEFDLDENGELDVIEGDNIVMDLIQKNQKEIGEFDHKIIQNLVKLNNFLNVKKENLTKLFNVLKKVETKKDLKEVIDSLKMSIENYQLLLVHSINMIVSIKIKEYVTYYELYENFDKMGVFNSEFENQLSSKLDELSGKLSNISGKLSSIISSLDNINFSINQNGRKTRESIRKLTYVTSSSFKSLQSSVTKELSSIRGGVGLNNLLTGINTYQLYKLNQNTKSLRG
tara:strand:- start:413 stop:1981 length:1569 start_codon:yes stop_codon:yes gene_type:complete